jgi:8-amino-3,8-dideoxy-alpha-D-manno-octulosonate transaminase
VPGYELFGSEEQAAINELFDLNGGVLFAHSFESMRNGVYKVREFEAAISNKFNVPFAQAVSSCTAALRVALAAIGVGPGDEVIIPSFTFVATAEAVIESGANLVIVDIDDSYTMDPAAFEAAITPRTVAVIPVHMMSAPADMDRICAIASKHQLKVIEDAAWGVGGTWRGRALGTIGDIGCYSFDAGKCISTGEGGMIVTSNQDLFVKSRAFHDHGHEYSSTISRGMEGAIGVGFNFRMTELQGVIGIVQLSKLDFIREVQRKNKALIKNQLQKNGFPYKFRRIHDQEGDSGDAIFFMLEDKEQAKRFVEKMMARGVATKNVPDAMQWHFAKNWTHMFNKYGWYRDTHQFQWKISADILEKSVAIPVFVKMTESDISSLVKNLVEISEEVRSQC